MEIINLYHVLGHSHVFSFLFFLFISSLWVLSLSLEEPVSLLAVLSVILCISKGDS